MPKDGVNFIFRKDTMHILSYNSFVSYQCEDTIAFEIMFDTINIIKYSSEQSYLENESTLNTLCANFVNICRFLVAKKKNIFKSKIIDLMNQRKVAKSGTKFQ